MCKYFRQLDVHILAQLPKEILYLNLESTAHQNLLLNCHFTAVLLEVNNDFP